jgi:diadenosine tetraphosphate (Ap4A) HIT family hydrolase
MNSDASAQALSLHPVLRADTVPLGDLLLSQALIATDANYPWLILVPRRAGVTELIDLDAADRAQLMDEIAAVSTALRKVTACDKLNVAALGNMVAQLHVHVIARRKNDAAWPKPVWGVEPARAYAPDALDRFHAALRRELAMA